MLFQQTFVDHMLAGGLKSQNALRLATLNQLGFGKDANPADFFNINCAFCHLACWEAEEERRENLKIIRSSGSLELKDGEKKVIQKDLP
ncbi:MAG: hypothetical protein SVM80_06310 [Halobacteriota archaeon]|nr:hypothetical protein [Halobacteriota archaeon]